MLHPNLTHQLVADRERDLIARADRARAAAPARRRARCALLAAPLLAAVVAFASPATAGAAVANVNGSDLQILDGGGEDNIVSVSQLVDGRLLVKDARGMAPGQGCLTGFGGVVCSGATVISASLNRGNDSLFSTTSLTTVYRGGDGDDLYEAGQAAGSSRVSYTGGSGRDTASYTSAARGVTVTKDGQANDGRTGVDQDNIGADVEMLFGSQFGDSLTGSAKNEQFIGLGDDDALSGGAGLDVFTMDAQADGPTGSSAATTSTPSSTTTAPARSPSTSPTAAPTTARRARATSCARSRTPAPARATTPSRPTRPPPPGSASKRASAPTRSPAPTPTT